MIAKTQSSTFTFTSILFLALSLSLSSCNGNEENKETDNTIELDEDFYEFQGVSLASHEIPAMIMLPDETANIGASTKPEIIHTEGDFKWEVSVGQNFQINIEDYGDYTDMVEYKKKELKDQEMFAIKYLVDEKDIIVYERVLIVKGLKNASAKVGIEHKSYHVYGQKIIKGITYELRSRDEGYEKSIIELMAKSIKSLKPIKA